MFLANKIIFILAKNILLFIAKMKENSKYFHARLLRATGMSGRVQSHPALRGHRHPMPGPGWDRDMLHVFLQPVQWGHGPLENGKK